MNLGIDIGSTKTVIYSTKDHGTIVEDEFGKREIATVLERTRPVRSFGKSVSGDNLDILKVRNRFFMENLTNTDCQENLFMFLNYLERIIQLKGGYKDVCLAIPESFSEEEKQILKSLVTKCSLNVGNCLTHLTSIAACAALRNYNIPEEFMIIDCGYSKTSVGLFKFIDHKLTPIKRWTIKIGGRCFDEAINKILIKEYNLPDSPITREKIYKEINTVKRGLNDLPSVNLKIFTEDYQICNMTVQRDKYLEALKPVLEQFTEFFEAIKKESNFNGYIEVVGNNSHNAYIQNILKKAEFNTTLSSSESAALGACLAQGVNSRKMQFYINEILGNGIAIKLEGENVKPTVIFESNAILTSDVTKIKYHRKSSFNLEVLENGIKVGTIKITKKETDSPETIAIKVVITPFLTFDVVGVEGGTDLTYQFESKELSEERLMKIQEIEDSYRSSEVEIKLLAEKRNYLENLLDSFDAAINKAFPGLITQEDKQKIDEIRDAFFDSSPVTKTLQEEENLKNSIYDSLSFIGDKIKNIENTIKAECEQILNNFDSNISKELKHNTYASRNLNSYIYNLRGYLSSFKLDFETVNNYNKNTFENLKHKILNGIIEAQKEEEKENKKEQEEKTKKENEVKEKDGCCNDTSSNCCRDNSKDCCSNDQKESCCNDTSNNCCRNDSKDCCSNDQKKSCCNDASSNCPCDEHNCCKDNAKDCCSNDQK